MPFDIDRVEHMGWLQTPSPLVPLPSLAEELDLEALWVKRDDGLEQFGGGNKIRKLNLLCAEERLQRAKVWHSVGTMGSGHLRACSLAARATGHLFVAHSCQQPATRRCLLNLAVTASLADELHIHRDRLRLALASPELFLRKKESEDKVIIASGGSDPAGTAAFVFAAWELLEQCSRLGTPTPDRVYLPLGSGGAALGLALGFAAAGEDIEVRAVAVIERWLLPPGRLRLLHREVMRWFSRRGLALTHQRPLQLTIDHCHLGPGYGHGSAASRSATQRLRREGQVADPIYGGKAMAALLFDSCTQTQAQRPLLWQTSHSGGTDPIASNWRQRLPRALDEQLGRYPDILPAEPSR